MQIYLPIAELSVDIILILGLGGAAGILSGMFGIGGGFLLTPLLIFIGVPPAVAVASTSNQIIAASASGFLTHWRKKNVDFQMGTLLLLGGLAGSSVGVWIFTLLKKLGQIDLVISLSYVGFLTLIGGMMAYESLNSVFEFKKKRKKGLGGPRRKKWIQLLPFKIHFERSDLHISAVTPVVIGFIVGILVSIMGIGGGFFMIPAMIYILGMPTSVVIGTSLFQVIFVTANVTILHAINTQTVDVMLALLLLTGSVIGAQVGIRLATRLKTEYLRGLLALIVLGVAVKLALSLLTTPGDLYSVTLGEHS